MDRAERYWKHQAIADSYFSCSSSSPKHADEVEIFNSLETLGEHIVVDFGIGGGRELDWINKLKNTTRIIGVDYSERTLTQCQRLSVKSPKPLTLLVDDFRQMDSLTVLLDGDSSRKAFLFLANVFGNLEICERLEVLKKTSSFMKQEDRLFLYLFKRSRTKGEMTAEAQYYQKYYSGLDQVVIKELFGSEPSYYYDFEENNVVTACNEGPVVFSHRWEESEIRSVVEQAGLKIEKIKEGNHAFVAIAKV